MVNFTFNQANELYRLGSYHKALSAYKQLLIAEPRLTSLLEMNIKHTLVKLGRSHTFALNDIDDFINSSIEDEICDFKKNSQLISVVVTSFNVEEYIENSLTSLLSQSYTNLEIIVVDDYSSDGTVQLVKRMSQKFNNIRLLQLNSNLGTYFAKNYGIQQSRGEIIFFQDGDDISHPQRIALMVNMFKEKMAVRCGYLRYDSSDNSIIKINGSYTRLGLITLGFKKCVFDQIGYFNCTTKGSDDEFFHRFINYYGKTSLTENDLPLYYAVMRENSLCADMLNRSASGEFHQLYSTGRENYVTQFKQLHQNLSPNKFNKFFCFPRIRDAIPVDTELSLLCNPKSPVIINIFLSSDKFEDFIVTIESFIFQSDLINIYSNNASSSIFVRFGNKVIVHELNMSNIFDLNYLQINNLFNLNKPGYHIVISVAANYPPDYVNTLINHVINSGNNILVHIVSQNLTNLGISFHSTLLNKINLNHDTDYSSISELLISAFMNSGISIQDIMYNGLYYN